MTSDVALAVGDLVLILFPFTDLSSSKRRPALLVTRPDIDGDFIAAAVTSRSGHEASVALDDTSLVQGRLAKPSWVRADKLFTFHKATVVKHIGRAKPQVVRDTLRVLCPVLGCT